ncbi:DNA modification methylase [Candidatus Falkowbacteria bacterium]|nr:DNA modification methylase [Candidatus Falkowbacteria bacterium]
MKKIKQKTDLKIEKVDVRDLKMSEYNPRIHSPEAISQLKESIKRFGEISPIVVNRAPNRNFVVISGHMRIKACQQLGYEKIPTIFVNISNIDREKELNLRMNRGGDWDYNLMKNFDIDMLLDVGFDNSELSHIWDQTLEIEDDNFEVEKEIKKIKKTNIKVGDLFQLGSHKLLCADSQEQLNVKKLCGNKKVDLIYSDPPFNIGLNYNSGISQKQNYGGKTNDKKSDTDYKEFLKKTITNGLAVSNPDLHVFYYSDQKYIGLLQTIYRELGIKNQRVCLWIKNGLNLTPQIAFNKSYEPCIYGTLGKPYLSEIKNLNEILNKEVGTGNRVSDDLLDLLDIWLAKRIAGQNYEHPTEKPITLHEKPLKRCSKPGDIILDLFAGSGSTILACQQLKRVCYALEVEPIFCQLIINRFEKYANQKTKKLN